jgi:hypothetical protein
MQLVGLVFHLSPNLALASCLVLLLVFLLLLSNGLLHELLFFFLFNFFRCLVYLANLSDFQGYTLWLKLL